MARALRVEFPGAIYHVMARGVARMALFLDDLDRRALLREIETHVKAARLVVHALCLMINHLHLLCETPFGGLSRIMRDVLGNYASAFNRRHDRVGHLCQGRYKALLVQDGAYLLDCSRYIHLNPYKAGIEPEYGVFPWSSVMTYLEGASAIPWISTERILRCFSSRIEYRYFLDAGKKKGVTNPFDVAIAGLVIGDANFVAEIRRRVGKERNFDEQPACRLLQKADSSPGIEGIRSAVDACFADQSPCQRRRYLAWALHTHAWLKGCEIGAIVGLKRSGVSAAVRGIERRRSEDKGLAEKLRILGEQIQALLPDESSNTNHQRRIVKSFAAPR
jgi:putative transposase